LHPFRAIHPNHAPHRGRYETLGTLGVSTLLLVAAGGVGVHSLQHFGGGLAETEMELTSAAVALGVVSLVGKEALFVWTKRVAEKLSSSVLMANAWHHRMDSLSAGIALVGVGGASLGVPWLDPVGGLAVAALIGKAGVDLVMPAIRELSEEQLEGDELALRARQAMETDPDVLEVRSVLVRRYGHVAVVDAAVGLGPLVSLATAEAVASRVRTKVRAACHDVSSVVINTYPSLVPPRHAGAAPAVAELDAAATACETFEDGPRRGTESDSEVLSSLFAAPLASAAGQDGVDAEDEAGRSRVRAALYDQDAGRAFQAPASSLQALEESVRLGVLRTFPDSVLSVSHVRVHVVAGVGGGFFVQLEILPRASPDTPLRAIHRCARNVRAFVESMRPDILRADVHIEVPDEPLPSERARAAGRVLRA
jgi:cation diffusion facilitator family transporter